MISNDEDVINMPKSARACIADRSGEYAEAKRRERVSKICLVRKVLGNVTYNQAVVTLLERITLQHA